jgi:hypothetical protein
LSLAASAAACTATLTSSTTAAAATSLHVGKASRVVQVCRQCSTRHLPCRSCTTWVLQGHAVAGPLCKKDRLIASVSSMCR